MRTQEYVLGFLFSDHEVVLIRKTHPKYQAGKLNGVGGKIEDGESPVEAMVREFREEAGMTLAAILWRHYLTFHCTACIEQETIKAVTYLFTTQIKTHHSLINLLHSPTEEKIVVADWWKGELEGQMLHNVPWFIRMAAFDTNYYNIYMKEVEQ